jgi:bifunctional DNA-binding transcriptional regulator/antitoxin component of YhaV-PrlF toxin-antitoxin module
MFFRALFWAAIHFQPNLPMGYPVKIQKVERPTNRSYYVNFPVALAEAIGLEKGEDLEWLLEDKNTLVLQRIRPKPPRHQKHPKPKSKPRP